MREVVPPFDFPVAATRHVWCASRFQGCWISTLEVSRGPVPVMPATIYRSDAAAVFHVDLTPDTIREAAALASLDEREQARRERIKQPRPRRQFTLCRAALRTVLRRALHCSNDDLSFGTSTYGKPFAVVGGVPASFAFNVSHSGRHGLIALAPEGRIGVDVEERSERRDIDGDIRLLFAPEERARLNKADGQRRLELFWSLWTMKEALVKASGTGLARDTTSFTIPPAMDLEARHTVFRFPDTPSTQWQLERLDGLRFAAALAHEMLTAPDSDSRKRNEPGTCEASS